MSNEPSLLGEVARTVMSSKGFTRDDVGKVRNAESSDDSGAV